MKTFGLPLFFLLLAAAVITLACGSPLKVATNCGSYGSNTTGSLESVTLCPAVADASQYPNGEVPFVGIGTFTTAPSPAAMPTAAIWGACQDEAATNGVTVVNGTATCAAGASGTYTVWGTWSPVCLVIGPCGACGPTGTAQLTCP
jgi:hypothetical protein